MITEYYIEEKATEFPWWYEMDNDPEFIESTRLLSETCGNCANKHTDQNGRVFCELKCRYVGTNDNCPEWEPDYGFNQIDTGMGFEVAINENGGFQMVDPEEIRYTQVDFSVIRFCVNRDENIFPFLEIFENVLNLEKGSLIAQRNYEIRDFNPGVLVCSIHYPASFGQLEREEIQRRFKAHPSLYKEKEVGFCIDPVI